MQLLKDFFKNLALLLVLILILFVIMPETMSQIFSLYGMLFGPVALLLLVVMALPRRRRS